MAETQNRLNRETEARSKTFQRPTTWQHPEVLLFQEVRPDGNTGTFARGIMG